MFFKTRLLYHNQNALESINNFFQRDLFSFLFIFLDAVL